MKNLIFLVVILSLLSCSLIEKRQFYFKNGDVIFHTSKSSQSEFIQKMTNSKLTHVGVVYIKDGKPMVLEAVNPVKITPLDKWINRGVGKNYIVMRPKSTPTKKQLDDMYKYGVKNLNKPYDMKFQWSDSKMYCSELVYKIYYSAGISLCEPKKFEDYDFSETSTQSEVMKRYGSLSINLDETIVSPVDLYNSNKLKVIIDTY